MKKIIKELLLFTNFKVVRKYVGGSWSLLHFNSYNEDFTIWIAKNFKEEEQLRMNRDKIYVIKEEKWGDKDE